MNILWGTLMTAAGLFMLICGTVNSEFVIYQLMVARSKVLWGNAVHRFHQACGGILMVLGILWGAGVIWSNG